MIRGTIPHVASFWDSLRSAFGSVSAGPKRAARKRPRRQTPPAPRYRGRTALKYGEQGRQGTRTRAQLADRYDRNPPSGQAVTKTSSRFPGAVMGHGIFGGNYPARGNLRESGRQLEGTRSQLAHRRAQRAAQGYAASQPHRTSAELARPMRGVGRAARPAVGLPSHPQRVPAERRQPRLTGIEFAGGTGRKRRAG